MHALKLIGKVAAITIAAVIAYTIVVMLWNFLILGVARIIGIDESYFEWVPTFLIFALFFIPKRFLRIKWPITIKAKSVTDAPIGQVWAELEPKARNDYYLPTISEIREVPGHPDRFEHVLSSALAPDDKERVLNVQVVACEAPHYCATFTDSISVVADVGIDSQTEEIFLTKQDGQTLVELRNTVSHISLMFLITLLIIHPMKDALRTLKAKCEGTDDRSWIMKSFDSGGSVQGGGVTTDLVIAGTTVVVVLTAMVFGIIYIAARFAA